MQWRNGVKEILPFAVFEPDNKENEDEYKKIFEEYKNLVRKIFFGGMSRFGQGIKSTTP